MRILIAVILMLPGFVCAQDYTIYGENSNVNGFSSGDNQMIVIPFHEHNFISEVDRMLTPAGMDPIQMREKIRRKCTMETTMAFSDSIDVLDASIGGGDSDVDLLEYLYNAMDYGYTALPEPESVKKKLDFKLIKKRNDKVLGAYSRTQNGQINRIEIDHDRYMTATFGNPGAVEYLQDIHAFEYILSITQLEIRRNTNQIAEGPYVLALHFELLDSSGEPLHGGKEIRGLKEDEVEYSTIISRVLPEIANSMSNDIWMYLNPKSTISSDFSDY